MTCEQAEAISDDVLFEIWETLPDGRLVTRFATSWATTDAQIAALAKALGRVSKPTF